MAMEMQTSWLQVHRARQAESAIAREAGRKYGRTSELAVVAVHGRCRCRCQGRRYAGSSHRSRVSHRFILIVVSPKLCQFSTSMFEARSTGRSERRPVAAAR
jgi:hypothetical protein